MGKFEDDVKENLKDPEYRAGYEEAGRLIELRRFVDSQRDTGTRSNSFSLWEAADELLRMQGA